MAPALRNTFGQLQSSSSEDEQVESVPSSSAHSTIEVEEEIEERDVEIDINEEEETDPQAFFPNTAMTSPEEQERPTEHSSTGSEADIHCQLICGRGRRTTHRTNTRIAIVHLAFPRSKLGCRCQ